MRKIKLLGVFIFTLSIWVFTSCHKETLQELLIGGVWASKKMEVYKNGVLIGDDVVPIYKFKFNEDGTGIEKMSTRSFLWHFSNDNTLLHIEYSELNKTSYNVDTFTETSLILYYEFFGEVDNYKNVIFFERE